MSRILTKALLQIFAFLPLYLIRQLGAMLGLLLYIGNSQSRKVTAENIERCFPSMPAEEQDLLVRQSLAETAKMALEVAPVWMRSVSWVVSKITRVHGEDLLTKSVDTPRGLIILAPHIGNWEVFSPYLSTVAHMTALYQPPKIAAFDQIIRAARERTGADLVPTDRRGVSSLLKALKAGGMTVILPDQVADSGTEHVPFFGQPAHTMTLVSNLVNRTGCQVLMGSVLRVQGGFELHFQEPDPAIYDPELVRSLEAMNRSVEACVMQAPAQYQWEYKRFRRPPPGAEKPYRF
mgnify:CR=1 FL=1